MVVSDKDGELGTSLVLRVYRPNTLGWFLRSDKRELGRVLSRAITRSCLCFRNITLENVWGMVISQFG